MLKIAFITLYIFTGIIMFYSIMMFYKTIMNYRKEHIVETYKLLPRWIYVVCMWLLISLLLASYTFVEIIILSYTTISTLEIITALIIFGEAAFSCAMVIITRKMMIAIKKKNDEIIMTLISTIEAKDKYTQGHSVHVGNVAKLIYDYLPNKIKNKVNLYHLTNAAILHDIGKIGIHDNILNKPDKLTEEERNVIEQHPKIGKQIFEKTSYGAISEIIFCHHERIDEQGYYGIAANMLPLESKIIAIADTYSALCTNRIYRQGKSYDEAMKIIASIAGTQLDSDLVDIFMSIPTNKLTILISDSS